MRSWSRTARLPAERPQTPGSDPQRQTPQRQLSGVRRPAAGRGTSGFPARRAAGIAACLRAGLPRVVRSPGPARRCRRCAPHRRIPDRTAFVEPVPDILRKPRPVVLDQHLGFVRRASHGHPYRHAARCMSDRVVDQVGQCALDQLQVCIQFQPARRRTGEQYRRRMPDQFELLHGIDDQLVEEEAFPVQDLVDRLQGNQLEQLLRQAPYAIALREGGPEQPVTDARRGIVELLHRLEMAMQRGQRGAQVMGDARHYLAMRARLLVRARALCLDPGGHLVEGLADRGDLVVQRRATGVVRTHRHGQRGATRAVCAHPPLQVPQRSGEPAEGEHAEQQGHRQSCRGGGAGAQPQASCGQRLRERIAVLSVEHDVEVARRGRFAGACRERRRAEDPGKVRPHRVGTMERQGVSREEAPHRLQVDGALAHHAGLADVGVDAARGIEHIDLDARVDRLQHRQQCIACLAFAGLGASRGDLWPALYDMARQSVRLALHRFLVMALLHLPSDQGHDQAEACQQQCEGQRQPGREAAVAVQGEPASTRRRCPFIARRSSVRGAGPRRPSPPALRPAGRSVPGSGSGWWRTRSGKCRCRPAARSGTCSRRRSTGR